MPFCLVNGKKSKKMKKGKKVRKREDKEEGRRGGRQGGIGREGRVRRSRGRIEGQQQVSGSDDSSSTGENGGEQRMESGVG